MSLPRHILFLHGRTWQIATVTGGHVSFADMLPPPPDQHSPSAKEVAERVAEELVRLGYTGQGVTLALNSGDCLAASIDVTGLPRGDRKAMLYRLEEKLPMAAESVVADFAGGGERALGVCVREDTALPLVNALERSGVAVQSVNPAALLAAQQLADGETQILIIGEEDRISIIAVRQGIPVNWSLLPNRRAELSLHLDMLALETGEEWPIRACGVDAALLEGSTVTTIPTAPRQVAAIAGAALLENRLKPWIEFRRGSLAISDRLRLHRRPIEALLGAVALLLICMTLGLLWRAHRYAAAATAADRRMAFEFSTAFPGWARPSNLRAVVESETRKLGPQGTVTLPPEARESAVATMHSVLSQLPAEVRFRFESLAFNELTFDLAGRVRNFAEVDTMASAARLSGADVPPPQAHRDAEGFWNFTLHGTKQTAVAKK